MSKQDIPVVPVETLGQCGREWGRRIHPGDHTLNPLRLIATRSDTNDHRQALYQTIENPKRGRDRGFIVDDRMGFCGENTIAPIMKHSDGWPWQWVKDTPVLSTSARSSRDKFDPA